MRLLSCPTVGLKHPALHEKTNTQMLLLVLLAHCNDFAGSASLSELWGAYGSLFLWGVQLLRRQHEQGAFPL